MGGLPDSAVSAGLHPRSWWCCLSLPCGEKPLWVTRRPRGFEAVVADAPCASQVPAGSESSAQMMCLPHVGFQDLCSSSEQGTPELLRTSDCDFVFEWETPLVCPDEVKMDGCSLTDEQLYYSFNLSSLSKSTFKVLPLSPPPGTSGQQPGSFW